MPLLTWDPYDLFAVLGVIPSQDEFETSHQYLKVHKKEVR